MECLPCKVDDNIRLIRHVQKEDVPGLSRQLNVYWRNRGGISLFIDKCMQASDFKMVGDCAYRRNYIQQGKVQSDGELDQETM